jgi:hypothetical protein
MSETSVSEQTNNSDNVTQVMDSDDTVATNSSTQPSVAVLSSGVSSSVDGESVQEVEAAYERMKAEVDEQRKRFFREEMAKLKVLSQQLERQRAASSLQESSRQMFLVRSSFETPVSSAFLSSTPPDFQQGPTSTKRRVEHHDMFEVAGRSYSWVQVNKASVQGACKPLLAVETSNYGNFNHSRCTCMLQNAFAR